MKSDFYKFARDFFGVGKDPFGAATFGAPEHGGRCCRKCSGESIQVRYFKPTDMLELRCFTCGFEWSEKPADRVELGKSAEPGK